VQGVKIASAGVGSAWVWELEEGEED